MAIAPSIHVQVLLVQAALLLVAVAVHAPCPGCGLELEKRPLILTNSMLSKRCCAQARCIRIPKSAISLHFFYLATDWWCATWIVLVSSPASACAISSTSRSKSVLVSHQAPTVGPKGVLVYGECRQANEGQIDKASFKEGFCPFGGIPFLLFL